ncbi:MAG: hypothetical protein E7E64_08500 [Clostridium celatum]|nr:hypothetical protein [Clostridium celatum]MDU4978901.1 hypothetical protein [Clostridium celatum]
MLNLRTLSVYTIKNINIAIEVLAEGASNEWLEAVTDKDIKCLEKARVPHNIFGYK